MNNVMPEVDVPETPVETICDPQQIEQALIALEINAIEAMPDGGTLRITMKKLVSQNEIEIKVIDNGIGINDEDLEHIFEPFFTTKKDGKGTGLGLAVVHGIIERHNGRIEVDSRPGAGTTVTILLPVNPQKAGGTILANVKKN
jgi:two-component system NtrC family sensor kinase